MFHRGIFDCNVSRGALFKKLFYSEVQVLNDQHLILFALISSTDFFSPLTTPFHLLREAPAMAPWLLPMENINYLQKLAILR